MCHLSFHCCVSEGNAGTLLQYHVCHIYLIINDFHRQVWSLTLWCCTYSKAFGLEMKCCRYRFQWEGQIETLVCRTSVMERFPDRPVQFNSKASKATLQTCPAWLDVLKSLRCSYVVWQIAFFSTEQLIFLNLYLVFIPASFLDWMLNYRQYSLFLPV